MLKTKQTSAAEVWNLATLPGTSSSLAFQMIQSPSRPTAITVKFVIVYYEAQKKKKYTSSFLKMTIKWIACRTLVHFYGEFSASTLLREVLDEYFCEMKKRQGNWHGYLRNRFFHTTWKICNFAANHSRRDSPCVWARSASPTAKSCATMMSRWARDRQPRKFEVRTLKCWVSTFNQHFHG